MATIGKNEANTGSDGHQIMSTCAFVTTKFDHCTLETHAIASNEDFATIETSITNHVLIGGLVRTIHLCGQGAGGENVRDYPSPCIAKMMFNNVNPAVGMVAQSNVFFVRHHWQ